MSISSSNTDFKELELIILGDCVIFPKSLIDATIQDGGKRERRNRSHAFSLSKKKNN